MSWKALAPIGLFVVLIGFFAFALTRDPSKLPSEMLDREFPHVTLPILETGEPVDSAELLSGDVRLVNIFGSWCVACLQEHPLLMRLAESGTIDIVGINWRDTEANATAWLARHGDPYDTILVDTNGRLVIELGVTGAPETFVVDADGRIRYKHVGPISEADWTDTFSPLVRELRKGATARPADSG